MIAALRIKGLGPIVAADYSPMRRALAALEVRDTALLTPALAAQLKAHGVRFTLGIHSRLPEAEAHLDEADRRELDAAFTGHVDPLVAAHQRQQGATAPAHDPAFDRLFTRIVMRAPAPIGLG